jgi:hypothetical protein
MAPFKSIAGRNLGKLVKSYITSNIGGTISGGGVVTGTIAATGGTVATPGDGFKYHMITAPLGTTAFEVTAGGGIGDVLIIGAGGGGGGGYYAGGGGAGKVIEGVSIPIQPGTVIVTAGTGGIGGDAQTTPAGNGGDSNFGTVIALGGGAGGSGPGINNEGADGGSGGGASYYVGPVESGVGIAITFSAVLNYTAYGNNAAEARNPGVVGGGGGGSGAAGSGTAGGDGITVSRFPASNIPVLAPVIPAMGPLQNQYGGGGGAGPGGTGGVGGGANGGSSNGPSAVNFLGGGGGGSSAVSTNDGGAGGPGIVVIRYPSS